MFRSLVTPARTCRSGLVALGLMAGLSVPGVASAQAQQAQPAQQGQAPSARMFTSDAGMILNFIKPDKTADFEDVIAKLKAAFQKSDKPERKQQAASWKVFRSPEPAGSNVLYVFIFDPAVKNVDYTVSNILAEAYPPDQLNEIYKKYADSYAQGQNIVNLNLVADMGK